MNIFESFGEFDRIYCRNTMDGVDRDYVQNNYIILCSKNCDTFLFVRFQHII